MTRLLLLAVLATGCRNLVDPYEGQQKGKLGHANFRLAPALGVQTIDATTLLGDFRYADCDEQPFDFAGGSNVDLRGGTLVQLQPGEWCGMQVSLQQPISASGVTHGGIAWNMTLDVDLVAVGDGKPFTIVEDRYYVFELGFPEWFRANDLQPQDTAVTSVTIDASHPSHADLVQAIALASALYQDPDGSTTISAGERATSLVAAGANRAGN